MEEPCKENALQFLIQLGEVGGWELMRDTSHIEDAAAGPGDLGLPLRPRCSRCRHVDLVHVFWCQESHINAQFRNSEF